MIRVDRGVEPNGFATRSANWQKRFEEALKQEPKLTPNKFWSQVRREIRPDAEALRVAFHEKCAFCESKMAHPDELDIMPASEAFGGRFFFRRPIPHIGMYKKTRGRAGEWTSGRL